MRATSRSTRRDFKLLAITLACGASLIAAAASHADVLHVPADHPTIQGAIDAAASGDEVVVAPGTYHEAIDFLGKAITVRSSDGRDVTTIDASTLPQPVSVVTFASGETRDAVLEGFTITGGTGTPYQPLFLDAGGGVFISDSNPTIRNCVSTANSAGFGVGICALDNADPKIENCHIYANSGVEPVSFGGGIGIGAGSTGHIVNCVIESNDAHTGGGLTVYGNVVGVGTLIEGCLIQDNNGGANVNNSGKAVFKNCEFAGNQLYGASVHGVILSNPAGTATFENCHFSGHTFPGFAKAISTGGTIAVFDSTFIGNVRAIEATSSPEPFAIHVSDSHFEGHSAGAVLVSHFNCDLVVNDSLFCNNASFHINGPWSDLGGNEFYDECPAPIPGDLDGDGSVGVQDLLLLLGAWGECDDCTPGEGDCFGDLDQDCTVGVADMLMLLANWG